jgi:hypothetical protein
MVEFLEFPHDLWLSRMDLEKNTNGNAKGPNMIPMISQNVLSAFLFAAINCRHRPQKTEKTIKYIIAKTP